MSIETVSFPKLTRRPRVGARLRRLGLGGFAFFFAKGLLWLAVPAVLRLLG